MTKHNVEDGYTRIANTLLDSLGRWPRGDSTMRVLVWVMRNSYGYNRKFTQFISVRELGRKLCMPKTCVSLAIRVLIETGVLERREDGGFVFDKKAFEAEVSGVPPAGQQEAPEVSRPRDESVPPAGQSVPPAGQPIYIGRKDNLKERKTGDFSPPTLQQVEEYCGATGAHVNAGKWFSHYKANGWMIGSRRMQDWKASVDSWAYSESVVPAAASSGAPRVNPAEAHLQAMDLVRRTEAFHDRATKGGRCAYCKSPVPKFGMCHCEKYQAALGKIKGIELWKK